MASNLFLSEFNQKNLTIYDAAQIVIVDREKMEKKHERILQNQRNNTIRYGESHMDCIVCCNSILEREREKMRQKNLHSPLAMPSKCNLHSYGVCAFIIKKCSHIMRITSLYHRFSAASHSTINVCMLLNTAIANLISREKWNRAENWSEEKQIFSHAHE